MAEVAVTDTELGAQSLLMTQCHDLYFSQQLMERLIRVSHHRCVQADEQNHISNLTHSLLGWRENFLNYPTIAPVCAPSPSPSPNNAIPTRLHTQLLFEIHLLPPKLRISSVGCGLKAPKLPKQFKPVCR